MFWIKEELIENGFHIFLRGANSVVFRELADALAVHGYSPLYCDEIDKEVMDLSCSNRKLFMRNNGDQYHRYNAGQLISIFKWSDGTKIVKSKYIEWWSDEELLKQKKTYKEKGKGRIFTIDELDELKDTRERKYVGNSFFGFARDGETINRKQWNTEPNCQYIPPKCFR